MTNISKQSFLSFKLDDEIFAISVYKVLEVLEKQKITKVPNVPDYIKGVINFRGDILPVIETRLKFNMPERKANDAYVIIVLELEIDGKHIVLGAIADGVKDVLDIPEAQIKQVPEMGNRYNAQFLAGMIKIDDGFIMILDIDKVFSVKDLDILKATSDEGEAQIEE